MQAKVEYGFLLDSSFGELLRTKYSKSKKIILVDDSTHEFCLPYLIGVFDELAEAEIILLPEGEETKSVEIAFNVWQTLTEYEISRKDLIINLGGGVVSDFGGFIAATYKRGLDFINIPTSLLAMVDASIGGKTGVNLGPYKNQIGSFSQPQMVYIDASFLATLHQDELHSGQAEMLKHGLLEGKELFQEAVDLDLDNITIDILKRFSSIKSQIVEQDEFESGERKKLNLGHTVGHALEGAFIGEMSHGHAVAIGLLVESYISLTKTGLPINQFVTIDKAIRKLYNIPKLDNQQQALLLNLLSNDKKNFDGEIKCVLLNKIGQAEIDVTVNVEEIKEAIDKNLA